MFSNVVNHAIVVRRMSVAGLGNAAKFTPGDQEYRFNCKFSALERGSNGATPDSTRHLHAPRWPGTQFCCE